MISIANALNLLWVVVSVTAGAYLLRHPDHIRARFRAVVAVLLAAVCLFPVISASDDEIRVAILGEPIVHTPSSTGAPSPEDPEKQQTSPLLARLLDSLDAAQITPCFTFFASLEQAHVLTVADVRVDSCRPAIRFGRSPPSA